MMLCFQKTKYMNRMCTGDQEGHSYSNCHIPLPGCIGFRHIITQKCIQPNFNSSQSSTVSTLFASSKSKVSSEGNVLVATSSQIKKKSNWMLPTYHDTEYTLLLQNREIGA